MSHERAASRFQSNPDRAGWHDAAVWHVRARRDAAAATVPDWNALREHAEATRTHTLSRLDHYLSLLIEKATAAGVEVHYATDAEAFRSTVGQLLLEAGATRIVKSKSMLTEECGLNPYLESRGIHIADTDLGERIVQLRGERPSHIVMPALHLQRTEVGATFHQHLGTPAGESDPTRLTRAARHDLRKHFLAADAGITGVNFAIAEDGTFVVCTNEGNADLGAHLPPLHILCMGIDKVIPRRSDLAVFLRLLARSATGQPITAYTSIFRSPAPGARMHLVLVDNGRTELLRDEAMRPAAACIRCGACLNTCPVYRRSGGHAYGDDALPGPIGSVLAGARSPERHNDLAHACTLCGSCKTVCPVGVPLPAQLLELRQRSAAADPWPWRALRRTLGHVLTDRERARIWGDRAAQLMTMVPRSLRPAGPTPATTSFRAQMRQLHTTRDPAPGPSPAPGPTDEPPEP